MTTSTTPAPPARRRALVLLLAAALVALAWLRPLDDLAHRHLEAGLARALATYAVARTINGVISVVQETGVSAQPGGVGMTFAPAQFLDPLNDLVEQVSTVMLAVCVSFAVQLMLFEVGGSVAVSALMSAALLAWAAMHWRGRAPAPWATRLVVALVFVRFAVPLAATGSELTYHLTLADQYDSAQQGLDAASGGVARSVPGTVGPAAAGASSPATPPSVWERLRALPESMDIDARVKEVQGRLEALRSRLEGIVEQIVRVVAIFTLQTVLLPALFLWLLLRALEAALMRPLLAAR